MNEYKYIMGYSKADGDNAVTINYFASKTLQELQDFAQRARNKGCIVHKFGRITPSQQLPSTYDPKA